MDNYNNIKQINGYYLLGMELSNSINRVVQQFKFSNKELQTANGLNWYDFSARMYDPAIGRFTSNDPLADKYYPISQYAYCGNNPIKYIDPTGKEIVIGSFVDRVLNFLGIKTEYVRKVELDIKKLKQDNDEVKKVITDLENSPNTHIIEMPQKGEYNETTFNKKDAENKKPQGTNIAYDPDNKKNKSNETRTPRVGLSHELQHASDLDNGKFSFLKTETGIYIYEVDAINTENKIRLKTNDKKRTTYGNKRISPIWLE